MHHCSMSLPGCPSQLHAIALEAPTVRYIAPEITFSSRRDTGFGWPLHMVSVAKAGASNLEGTEVPGSILGGLGRISGICLRPTPRESSERLERGARGSESGGRGIVTYIAPEITASSRRDTGFGWPLHQLSPRADAGQPQGMTGLRLPSIQALGSTIASSAGCRQL